MKKLWEKIKTWFLSKWKQLKAWFIAKPLTWFKKNWMIVVNYFVILMSYSIIYGHDDVVWAELLLGLWIFTSIVVGIYELFIKK